MAIVLEAKTTLPALVVSVTNDADAVTKAKALDALGHSVKVESKCILIVPPDLEKDMIHIPVSAGAYKLAVEGSLGGGTLGLVRKAILTGLQEAYSQAGLITFQTLQQAEDQVMPLITAGKKVAAIKELRVLTGLALKEAKDLVELWWAKHYPEDGPSLGELGSQFEEVLSASVPTTKKKKKKKTTTLKHKSQMKSKVKFSKEGVMNESPVSLKQATAVFQPIKGTDTESVYFAIAVGPRVNVGCRVKANGYTSIRVEGPGLNEPDVESRLADVGLSKASGGHWSIHLEIPPHDDLLARKTVGAILDGMDMEFEERASSISSIIGKGH